MSSLYRLVAGVVIYASPRRVISAPFTRSALLPSAPLPTEPPSAPEIFDVFDAPVRLRGRPDQPFRESNPFPVTHTTSTASPSHSKSIYHDVLGLPWSLPPPVTFDGPASPPHLSPSAIKNRRQWRQNSPHYSRGVHGSAIISYSTFMSPSEPLCQLFDGPSRISGYQYSTPQNKRCSLAYVFLTLCLTSACGWLALKYNSDLRRQNNARSPK